MKTRQLETPPKEEDGRGGGGFQEDGAKKTAGGFQSHLELRLGISLNSSLEEMVTSTTAAAASSSDRKGGSVGPSPGFLTTPEGLLLHQRNGAGPGWAKRWFSDSGNGFVHPWSLAARQQKAVFEKAHQNPNTASTMPRAAPPPLPPVVGWPPVRAFRRNLVIPQPSKPEMEGEKDAKRAKTIEVKDGSKLEPEVKVTMYVKVNMEGYAVGRKIDLKAHDSYETLSRTLQRMFNNFLSANFTIDSKQDEQDDVPIPDYLLIYEDHEGDRMLVGDVPWEMFVTSVKRLYIAHTPKAQAEDDGRVAADKN